MEYSLQSLQPFDRLFQVEKKFEAFYHLLCKESLDREDVEAMEKENLKDCHELVQMFRGSKQIKKFILARYSNNAHVSPIK